MRPCRHPRRFPVTVPRQAVGQLAVAPSAAVQAAATLAPSESVHFLACLPTPGSDWFSTNSSGLMQAPPLLPPSTSTGSGWTSGGSTAPSSWPQAWVQPATPADTNAQPKDAYSSIPPIPAATDYRAPAWSESKAEAKPTAIDSNRSSSDFSRTHNQPSGIEPRTPVHAFNRRALDL